VLPDEDATADFYDAVYRRLLSAGFCRYEVSNFALKGLECRHNLNYWRCGEYIGLGVSAHSYLHGLRRSNIKNLEKYIRAMDEGRLPVVGRHRLTEKEKAYECFILGLRTEEGVDAERISSEFNKAADDYLRTAFELAERGLLEKVGSRLRVPSDKFYVLNSILCEF
jgi:oxygen-independent coproporphyrinogen-3 oxidase